MYISLQYDQTEDAVLVPSTVGGGEVTSCR